LKFLEGKTPLSLNENDDGSLEAVTFEFEAAENSDLISGCDNASSKALLFFSLAIYKGICWVLKTVLDAIRFYKVFSRNATIHLSNDDRSVLQMKNEGVTKDNRIEFYS